MQPYQLSLFAYFGVDEYGYGLSTEELELMHSINKFCKDNYSLIEEQLKLNLYKDII